MAIAFDTSNISSTSSAPSLTYSHTCTGANRILFVAVDIANTSNSVSGVTYNGVSMTVIDNQQATQVNSYLFYLIAPTTGANNVIVSTTGGNNRILSISSSYTGANQFTQPDAHAKAAASTVNVNVVNSNCWVVGMSAFAIGTGVTWTAGSGFTLRQSTDDAGGFGIALEDTNATIGTGNIATAFSTSSGSPAIVIGASFVPAATSLFWVGGTGNWDTSTSTHWALSTGGSGGWGVPDSGVAVTFDGSSGAGTTTVSATTACSSLTMTGYTGTLTQSNALTTTGSVTLGNHTFTVGATFSVGGSMTVGASTTLAGSSDIYVSNNLTLTSGMTLTLSGQFVMAGNPVAGTITTAGKTLLGNLAINTQTGTAGVWALQDSLTTSATICITKGTLNMNNFNVTSSDFNIFSGTAQALIMGSGTFTLTGTGTVWNCSVNANLTLTANTSTIELTNATSSTKTFSGGGFTYNNLWITGSGTGAYTIVGNNTFNDFKVDTPPHTVNFTALSTQTVSTFTVSGTAGNLMTLQSTVSGQRWNLIKSPTGTVSPDYLSLQDSHVS